jgi:hypothetical protein
MADVSATGPRLNTIGWAENGRIIELRIAMLSVKAFFQVFHLGLDTVEPVGEKMASIAGRNLSTILLQAPSDRKSPSLIESSTSLIHFVTYGSSTMTLRAASFIALNSLLAFHQGPRGIMLNLQRRPAE